MIKNQKKYKWTTFQLQIYNIYTTEQPSIYNLQLINKYIFCIGVIKQVIWDRITPLTLVTQTVLMWKNRPNYNLAQQWGIIINLT